MKKNFIKIIALACVGTFCLTSCQASKAEESSLPRVRVSKFEKNDVMATLSAEGVIESADKNTTILTNLTTYKVKKINVKVGDRVSQGDVVCELDTTELENEIASIEKQLSNANAFSEFQLEQYKKDLQTAKQSKDLQLNSAQKAIDEARRAYDNAKVGYENNLNKYNDAFARAEQLKFSYENAQTEEEAVEIYKQYEAVLQEVSLYRSSYEAEEMKITESESYIKNTENNYESVLLAANKSVEAAQYALDTYSVSSDSSSARDTQEKLETLKKSLNDSKIIAPSSGIISSINAQEGKACVDGIIMTTQNDSEKSVKISISEEDFLFVKQGMKAIVTTLATGTETFEGTVSRVVDIKSQNGFDGYISLENSDKFKIGMTAKVKLVTVDEKEKLSVKKSSLFSNDEGVLCLFEAEKQDNNKYILKQTEVDKTAENQLLAIVSADTLEEGDFILIEDPSKYSDGDVVDVRIINNKKAEEKGDSNAD